MAASSGAQASCCEKQRQSQQKSDGLENNVFKSVKEYYGRLLNSASDLKTNACVSTAPLPAIVRSILSEVHDEVLQKYYGCGLTIPQDFSLLEGLKVTMLNLKAPVLLFSTSTNLVLHDVNKNNLLRIDVSKVLDLGSGSGRDCYILSKLVGEKG